MENLKAMFAAVVLISGSVAFGHGEDKPGPHGGAIRMPGAFHTEVVQLGPKSLRIYLLDGSWRRPSVRDSEVQATFAVGQDRSESRCAKDGDSFVCEFPRSVDLGSQGKLSVRATRENQRGAVVDYATPLKGG